MARSEGRTVEREYSGHLRGFVFHRAAIRDRSKQWKQYEHNMTHTRLHLVTHTQEAGEKNFLEREAFFLQNFRTDRCSTKMDVCSIAHRFEK